MKRAPLLAALIGLVALDDLGDEFDINIDNTIRWDMVGGFCGEIPG